MNLFYGEAFNIILIILIAIIISFLIIAMSYLVGPSVPDLEKFSVYECGFDPYEDARNAFDVRFYLVAILFIIFDLETVFFFPWCISLSYMESNGVWYMLDFIIELFVGYIYAWRLGALDWD